MNLAEELVNEFATDAIAYRAHIEHSDFLNVNRIAAKMHGGFLRIKQDLNSRQQFLTLLTHDNSAVRLMAAAYGLRIDELACKRVLIDFATNGPYAFEASQCLDRWNTGEWALDEEVAHSLETSPQLKFLTNLVDPIVLGNAVSNVTMNDVTCPEEIDVRIGVVNIYFANIIGINRGGLEFCPNSTPPSDFETLAWLWVIRPDMAQSILKLLGDTEFASEIRRMCA